MNDVLDAGPILDVVAARGGIATVLGGDQGARKAGDLCRFDRAYWRMVQKGTVTVWAADRFCIKVLGTLPELVYGVAFFAGCDEMEAA